jgi:cytochrome c556
MRDAAVAAGAAARRGEYDAARTAIGAVSKACTDCHGEYR